ncbi:MAG: hypothetical protein ACI8PB_004964 [Desulforhopalus sp.]|jgi:hypothetical protein
MKCWIKNQWMPVASWRAPCLSGEGSTSPCINPPLYPLQKRRTPNDYNSLPLRVLSTINHQAGRDSSWRGPLGIFNFSGKLGISENRTRWQEALVEWGGWYLVGAVASVLLILRSRCVCSEKDGRL